MRYAVFTVCMPEYTVEEGIEKLSAWGYDGVEWRVVNQKPSADGTRSIGSGQAPGYWSGNRCTISLDALSELAASVGKRCRDAGLEVCSIASYLRCNELDAIDRVFEACTAMGAPAARVGLPAPEKDENFRDYFDRMVELYAPVEKLALKHGVRSLLETHHGTAIASVSSVYRFVSNFKPAAVGVIHDAGNMVHEGFESYRSSLQLLGEYLGEVHVKNGAWEPTGETGPLGQVLWKVTWAGLKDGVVNWADVMTALKGVGYDGWLAIEDFSTTHTTEQKLTGGLAYLKALEKSA